MTAVPARYAEAIAAVRPDLADGPMLLHDGGWDSDAVEAGVSMFKFPKHATAPERLRREARLLALIRPLVPTPVPQMRLHETPMLFSEHRTIPGRTLETPQYEALPEARRQNLADRMSAFYAALHAIPVEQGVAAGAGPKPGWPAAAELAAVADRTLEPSLREFAHRAIAAYERRPEDDRVLGYFDGHGWNMAFDHEHGTLTGLYDFADAGIGERHREFSLSNFISTDLTERIVAGYERRNGLAIDRRTVALHGAVQRIAELAEIESNPQFFIANVAGCRDYMQSRLELAV